MKDYRKIFKDVINWELWDKLVAQTKKDIAKQLKNYKRKPRTNSRSYKIYCFNEKGKLVYEFKSLAACVKHLRANNTTIRKYAMLQYIYKGFLLSKVELRQDIAFAIYRQNILDKKIYQKKF